jgi:hypothetical protein
LCSVVLLLLLLRLVRLAEGRMLAVGAAVLSGRGLMQTGCRVRWVLEQLAMLLVMNMVLVLLMLVLMLMSMRLRVLVSRRLKDMALLDRTGHLARVVHIVVPDSIVARQRVSDAWVPPEPTALDGRRSLDGKNLGR